MNATEKVLTRTITISMGYPPPPNGTSELMRRILAELRPGESFDVTQVKERDAVLNVSRRLRLGVVTQKINLGYRIWRTNEWQERKPGHPPGKMTLV